MIEQQEILQDLAYEIAVRLGPNQGWRRKTVVATPGADGVHLRLQVQQPDGDTEHTTTLPATDDLARRWLRLREVMATPTAPSWTAATVVVTAKGEWPEPGFALDADFTYPS